MDTKHRLNHLFVVLMLSTDALTSFTPSKSNADQLQPQTLSARGGVVSISPEFQEPYTGNLNFAPNDLATTIPMNLHGQRGEAFGLPQPTAGNPLYGIQIAPNNSAFTTSKASLLTINVPSSLSTAKPVNLYITQFALPVEGAPASTPIPWSVGIAGSRRANTLTFSIPSFTLPASTIKVLQLIQ